MRQQYLLCFDECLLVGVRGSRGRVFSDGSAVFILTIDT